MSTTAADIPPQVPRKLPPVLGRLLSGTFWLALRTPLQALFALWQVPLILEALGEKVYGAYGFAWGFGFLQFLLEFGMSSALQRQVADRWTRGDREGVDRAVACGMTFYTTVALIQVGALLGIAYGILPYFQNRFTADGYRLIVKLLWLQAVTAPCYGLTTVVSSVLQAARRYDFIPRFELAVVVVRFLVLWLGVRCHVDFFTIVVGQTLVQVGLALAPALWVMIHELGHRPHFRGARLADYRGLLHISFYMFLIQLSVVLADKLDRAVITLALKPADTPLALYDVISRPFLQIRQTGWMLAYMVMPAVASLVAARDEHSLDRVKYDGTRLHVAVLLPIVLLAWVYAPPFLILWVGDKLHHDPALDAPLLRLFLVATLPLVLAVPVQAAFGMNKPKVVALAALAGSLVNLPLSYVLTVRLGVAGVIWGTVVTTLFSNLLVPGLHVFRTLGMTLPTFISRTLFPPAAAALALLSTTTFLQKIFPLHPIPTPGLSPIRWLPLASHLTVACLAYALGYLATPRGRADLFEILAKVRRRPTAD